MMEAGGRADLISSPLYSRCLRDAKRQQRKSLTKIFRGPRIDDKYIAKQKGKSKHVITSLERSTKRANRGLISAAGEERYLALLLVWKRHLRWMRLRIAYFKPLGKLLFGYRKRRQKDNDELMQNAKYGLRDAGNQPPNDIALRHFMRLYARYARDGRQGHWTVRFLLETKTSFNSRFHLAHFVIDRTKLKALAKSKRRGVNCRNTAGYNYQRTSWICLLVSRRPFVTNTAVAF